MTGRHLRSAGILNISLLMAAGLLLSACDENGEFSLGGGESAAADSAAIPAGVPAQSTTAEGDTERPDIFEVTDRGLWDGRPSLGGAWVAHPDVDAPERALIRNTATGETIIGALFRRERENPGPLLQISSDVAEELGVLAGSPTELYVVALRRVEVTEPAEADPAANPVIADLAAPVNVEATTLDPADDGAEADPAVAATAATAAAGIAAAAADTATPDRVEVNLPPAETASPATDAAAIATIPTPAAQMANLDGPQLQIGIFSVEENANGAADRLRSANIPTSVVAQQAGGRTVWRVVASPAEAADAETTLTRIKDLGFVDAFLVETDG